MDAVGKLIRLFVDLIITFETPKLKLPNGKITSKIMPRPCNKDGWPDKNAINCMVFHYLIAVTAMDTCAKLNSGMDTNSNFARQKNMSMVENSGFYLLGRTPSVPNQHEYK